MDNPNDQKPGEDSTKVLLEAVQAMKKDIEALNKRVDDVTSLNRQLLSTTEPPSQPEIDKAKRHAELEKKLREALHNA